MKTSTPSENWTRLIFIMIIVSVVTGILVTKWYAGRLSITQQAEAAFQEGNLKDGRALLLEHLAAHSDDDEARWILASSYAKSDPEIAIDYFQQVNKASRKFADAQRSVFLLASKLSRYDEAEQALDTLLEINPSDFGPKLAKAELYYQGKRYQDALPLIKEAIDAKPDRAESYILLADNFFDLNRASESIEPLRQALKFSPELITVHANLAYALHYSGQLDEAEEEAKWCLTREESLHRVRTILATIYRDQGQYEEALTEVNRSLQYNANDFSARILKAEILIFLRRAKEARAVLEPLYKSNSSNRELLSNLVRASAMSGDRDAARKYQLELAAAIKANPRSAKSNLIPTRE